ncbi:hypothetical protein [Hyalangium sp.]|uniref:hypothetical protein n=1 Tax=Hyalangium sp. TaxID=2028555 RepID=UPI002D617FC9|nr:hypothetical protein [Hyalangium sp.]HYH98619.1 hypothetical protein [Hyalangium sp.]
MRSNHNKGFKAVLVASFLSITLGAGAAHADVYDDTHQGWTYSNEWGAVSGGVYSGAYNGTLHLTQTPGSVATFTCLNSSSFDLYITTAANRGRFMVYVNGNSIGWVDAYSPTTQRQVLALGGGYWVGFTGNFSVTIVSMDTKSSASTGYFVDIDAIEC